MGGARLKRGLASLFSSLSAASLESASREQALGRLAEMAREALGSRGCNIVTVDLSERTLTQLTCSGFDREFAERMSGPQPLGTEGSGLPLSFELLARGKTRARYRVHEPGNGVVSPSVAARYGLRSVLAAPLKRDGRLIGYFNHFTASDERFTAQEKRLLQVFAAQAVSVLDRFGYRHTLERLSAMLGSLSTELITVPEDEFLARVSESARTLLDAHTCIVWKFDPAVGRLKIAAGEVDDEYKREELEPERYSHIMRREIGYLPDVTRAGEKFYRHQAAAAARQWVALLTAPMWVDDRLIGMLDIYTKRPRLFTGWEKSSFKTFADYAAISIQKAELLREAEKNLRGRLKLERLNDVMQEVSTSSNIPDLLEIILERSLELVGAERGWIAKFDLKTGKLHIVSHRGDPFKRRSLKYGEGITGLAVKEEKPKLADDVQSPEWGGVYERFWHDTRSELAVPILVNNALAHVGRATVPVTKPVGIINVESPSAQAFTRADLDVLWLLARHAATAIEKLEFHNKLAELSNLEHEIAAAPGWDETLQLVLRAPIETLGFEFVNISLVEPESNLIKTEYVAGIPESEQADFKRRARHKLTSNDIQACVVRSREVEVPGVNDPRYDQDIYKRFRHEQYLRVFVPMIAPSGERVIGTVEAAYKRGYRKHIYEQDVRTLQRFVDYTARLLERKQRALLPRILHEFEAPTVGIRNNVDFLKNNERLSESFVQRKYDDILTDCELLFLKIGELEHLLGGSTPVSKVERTWVYRDIIIKSVNQLKPLVADRGFEMGRIQYNVDDISKLRLYVNKAKLSSVVYNLLINSIKYAEKDPGLFNVKIAAEVTRKHYVIMFKDWGIGIGKDSAEKVFDEGYRAPEARKRFVSGSGLGLTIARKAMREMGGDLVLASCSRPTEFRVLLPHSLKEAPDDSLPR